MVTKNKGQGLQGKLASHTGSVQLFLNTIIGHILPQYHVIFDDKLSNMEHMSKVAVPGNW